MPILLLLACAALGGLALRLLHVPGGIFLGAAAGAAAYTLLRDLPPVRLPAGSEDAALVVLGAAVGAGITRSELTRLRLVLLPAVAAAVFLIVAGILAALLLRALGLAPAQDLLATSPGALSTVIAVALERGEGAAEVALFHTVRLLLVMGALPLLVALLPDPP